MNRIEAKPKAGRRVFFIWAAILLAIPMLLFESARKFPPDKPANFVPIGTNALGPGIMLYEPQGTQFMGTVLQTDAAHEFDNGDIEPGVLLKDRHRSEAWVKRTNLNKALVRSAADKKG